jgi:hypothetical protein
VECGINDFIEASPSIGTDSGRGDLSQIQRPCLIKTLRKYFIVFTLGHCRISFQNIASGDV